MSQKPVDILKYSRRKRYGMQFIISSLFVFVPKISDKAFLNKPVINKKTFINYVIVLTAFLLYNFLLLEFMNKQLNKLDLYNLKLYSVVNDTIKFMTANLLIYLLTRDKGVIYSAICLLLGLHFHTLIVSDFIPNGDISAIIRILIGTSVQVVLLKQEITLLKALLTIMNLTAIIFTYKSINNYFVTKNNYSNFQKYPPTKIIENVIDSKIHKENIKKVFDKN